MPDLLHRAHGAPWASWLLRPFGAVYGSVVTGRALLYDRGWWLRQRLSGRVISVGNLTVGGTGKTPIVIWIVQRLLARGVRVAVLSRGYRRRSQASRVLVSDGQQLLANPAEAGDEPYLIARRCPTAIVAVGADRYGLGRWVLEQHPVDCYVLDDGFQHLGLHRDVDLVLVDVTDPEGLKSLLPAGRLREPLTALKRASAVLLTRAESNEDVETVWGQLSASLGMKPPDGSPIRVTFPIESLVWVGHDTVKQAVELAGRSALAFCGIGNAASFSRLLERQGVKIADAIVFGDHHRYSSEDLERIRTTAQRHAVDLILTTEKDAVKLEALIEPQDRIWAVRLACDIVKGRERLEHLIFGTQT